MHSWGENDTISKLVIKRDRDDKHRSSSFSEEIPKSLCDELMEAESLISEFSTLNQIVEKRLLQSQKSSCSSITSSQSSECGPKVDGIPLPKDIPKTNELLGTELNQNNTEYQQQQIQDKSPFYALNKTANEFLSEFRSLSIIMDTELSRYASNVKIMHQKQFLSEEIKNEGKVEMLTKLLQEQKNKVRTIEYEYKRRMQAAEKNYKKKIDCLQQSERENKETTKRLQTEFNEVINKREAEIENLYAQMHTLESSLESYQGGTDDIAMNNEELLEIVQIKDEFIATIHQQSTNREKMNEQYAWKLEQADELLKMVEDERDKIESMAKKIILKLRQQLQDERSQNLQLSETLMRKDMAKDGNAELEVETREKFIKMAHRSSVGRRTCIIKFSGDDELPTVLKSLGWITPSNCIHSVEIKQ